MMKLLSQWLFFLCFIGTLNAEGVQAYNDSNIPLTVKVFDASGTKIGEFRVAPRSNKIWHVPLGEFQQYNQSTVPYRVIFYCESGEIFSEWSSVSPGEAVTALGGSGPRNCPKKKNGDQDQDQDQEPEIQPGKPWFEQGDSDTRDLHEF